jgi:hypothetical protein
MSATFIFLMVALKIPICGLLYIVWWAIHAEVEPVQDGGSDDGGTKVAERHPRSPLPRNPRRGPHGAPSPPSPARTRTVLARGRRRGLRSP